jgi:hypothetical protein
LRIAIRSCAFHLYRALIGLQVRISIRDRVCRISWTRQAQARSSMVRGTICSQERLAGANNLANKKPGMAGFPGRSLDIEDYLILASL